MIYIIKFIYAFFLPPGIFILFLLIFSTWLYKNDKAKAKILVLVTLVFYLISTPYIGNMLLRTLECRYQPSGVIKGDLLVMLGGGATLDTPNIDGSGHLTGSAANRLLTAVQLHKKTDLPIVISGGQVYSDSGNEAAIAERLLIGLGVSENKIILDNSSRNTTENAQNVKQIMKANNFKKPILITSAFHMERSVRNFARLDIDVQPYPTDYKTSLKSRIYANQFVPSYWGLCDTGIVLKEYLGLLALRVLG